MFVGSGVDSQLGLKCAYVFLSRKSTQVMFSAFCEVVWKGECWNRRIFPGDSMPTAPEDS